ELRGLEKVPQGIRLAGGVLKLLALRTVGDAADDQRDRRARREIHSNHQRHTAVATESFGDAGAKEGRLADSGSGINDHQAIGENLVGEDGHVVFTSEEYSTRQVVVAERRRAGISLVRLSVSHGGGAGSRASSAR